MPRTLSLRIGCCLNIFSPLIAHEVGRVDSQCCRIARRALDKSMKHRSNRKSHEIPRTETYSAHTALLILIYPLTIPDLCSERALMVCGRYKGDFPNTLKLRGIRADMTNSTIDIDVQQANDIPLIKILAKNQIDSVAKISLETGTVSEYTHTVLLKTEPQAITSKSGKKKENTKRLVTEQIKVLHNLGLGFGNVIATIENILPGDENVSFAVPVFILERRLFLRLEMERAILCERWI
ncbi:hypothetical protein Tco_0002384 [Tanacetum coccineum]